MTEYQSLNEDDSSDGLILQGFKYLTYRTVLYYILNFLTLGLPSLLCHWNPHWEVKLKGVPSQLCYADVVVCSEKDDPTSKHICKIIKDYVDFMPQELRSRQNRTLHHQDSRTPLVSSNGKFLLRYFVYRYHKYVWNDEMEGFRKINGLEATTLQNLTEYHGVPSDKRVQMRSFYGSNTIDVEVKSYWRLFVEEVLNPFYVFQIFSVLIWSFDNYFYYASCVVIISGISIVVALVETKRQSAMLKEMAQSSEKSTVTIRRQDGEEEDINSNELVPGDIILVPREGFVVPCDAVLINGSCIVNESMLTGESIPVQKSPLTPSQNLYDPELNKRNTIFCGTQVIQTRYYSGNKVAGVVLRTGFSTVKGELIHSIMFPKEVCFKFYSDAMKFVGILFCLAAIGMFYSAYCYISRGSSWYVILVRVLDIVTIVVPPALPAAMTLGTFYAQGRLKKKNIFCISPPRINFGGKLKLVCFDKTGTLTEDGLDLWCVVPVFQNDAKLEFGAPVKNPCDLSTDSHLIRAMASCHSLTYIQGKLVGDPLDIKMFLSTDWTLEEPHQNEDDYKKFDLLAPSVVKKHEIQLGIIKEFEFTPQLQRCSVVVKSISDPHMILYSKGAPEKILSLCKEVPVNFDRILDAYTVRGYRVLALGCRVLKNLKWHQIHRADRNKIEEQLEFCGLLVMQNSLKPATVPVIQELNAACIRSVMVTGDNILTAISVARECGILPSCDKVVIANINQDQQLEFTLAAQHIEESLEKLDVAELPVNQNVTASSGHCENSQSVSDQLVINLTEEQQESAVMQSPNMVSISAHTVLQLQDPNYHIVMTGKTWSHLEETVSQETINRIVTKGTVYARMSPENKSQLVETLQKLDYVVGMCGDGANDCSALKMAHVGISLSEAEASVAAPFTSNVPDISCVPNLIREGRCALVTSFSIFKYMTLYSLIQFCSVLILYAHNSNLADAQFLYIDLGITTTITIVMGKTPAFPTLVPQRPMGSLLSFQNVFSVLVQIIICGSIQITSMMYLEMQNWFVPQKPDSPDDLATLTWESTVIFSISSFQYLILALVFSKGPPYRNSFYTNGLFVISYVLLTAFTIVLTFYPISLLAKFFSLMAVSPETMSFRASLLIFPAANLVLSFLFEHEWTRHVVKKLGRKVMNKKGYKNTYKVILNELDNNLSWPPVTNPSSALS